MVPQADDRRARNWHHPYHTAPLAILAFAAACPALLSPAGSMGVPRAGGMVRYALPGAGADHRAGLARG